MYIKNKRGQSTVEYILLVTAVLAVIVALVAGKNGAFQQQLNGTLNTAVADMNSLGTTLSGSHGLSPAPNATTNTTSPLTVNVLAP